MQAELFELLKSVLKARRMTYAGLAKRLGLSEPTIKRIFAERDCKLSRMNEICAALELTFDDMVSEVNHYRLTPVASRLECNSRYCRMISSVTFPDVVEKYPRAQNRLPQ